MAQTESTESFASRIPPPPAQSSGRISRIVGIGGFLGIAAAGLGMVSGVPLLPIPSIGALTLKDPIFYWASTAFVALLVISLLFQLIGSGSLRMRLESGYPSVLLLTFLVGLSLMVFIPYGGMYWNLPGQVASYVVNLAILGSIFAILWQLWSIVYVDSSKTYTGLLAGILNAFWIPVLAIGMGLHNYSIANPGIAPFAVAVTTAAYVMLLVGQLMVVKFWWSPITSVREFGRSSETAKFGFGITEQLKCFFFSFFFFKGYESTFDSYSICSANVFFKNEIFFPVSRIPWEEPPLRKSRIFLDRFNRGTTFL